jgi:predicted house-cleaning noncanonical NTP pyrophosphatase (MazG superfamily)
MTAAQDQREKLVRDVYTYLPHRVAAPGERDGLLAAKFDEEVAEVKAAPVGSQEFIEELGDLIEVCYALGGEERVETARLAKWHERGGFDKLLVMRLEDRTDK